MVRNSCYSEETHEKAISISEVVVLFGEEVMNLKLKPLIEMTAVYILLITVVAFSSDIVKLGNTVGAKMVLTVLVYVILTAVPLTVMKLEKIPFSSLGFSKERVGRQLLVAAAISAVSIGVFVIIPLLIGINKTEVLGFKCRSLPILIFYILYDIICVGFGEEIAFRGYFYSRIKAISKKEWVPVVLSAILFGLWHFPNTLNIMNVVMTTILGLGYASCRWKIKNCSLLSLALAHGLHDAVITTLSYILL